MSIVFGTARKAPGRPIAMLNPDGSAGGPEIGSGKPLTPCARMQCEIASICALFFARSAPLRGGPPPGMYLKHCACAFLNAGAAGFIPFASWIPPLPLGSGKFGTP